MRKLKKVLALTLGLVMVLSICACKGSVKESGELSDSKEEKKNLAESVESKTEIEMPKEQGETIYVYSWNQKLGERLIYFKEKYPQYADRVEFVNLGLEDDNDRYKTAMETLLQVGQDGTDKYPSIFAVESDSELEYVQSDYTVSLDTLGIGKTDMENMYSYTLDYATFDGKVKALTWQAAPGCFLYRTDIAEAVLGTSDPELVQEMISDWDKFLEVADKMKAAGYKMLSGSEDIKYAMLDQKEEPWVTDETLTIDPVIRDYLETSKRLYDGEYTNKTQMGDTDWLASFDDNVFGWFVTPEYICEGIPAKEHMGEFSVCQGPAVYHQGGTYLNVAAECPDMSLAALVLKTLCCDEEVMTEMSQEMGDFVNNETVMQKLSDEGKTSLETLGGQNPVPIWMETAEKLDLSNASAHDERINAFLDKASTDYNAGLLETTDEAVELVRKLVTEAYNYIMVE